MVDKNRQITAAAYRCIQTQQSNTPLLHSSSLLLCLTLCAAGSNYFHRNASRVKWNKQNTPNKTLRTEQKRQMY